MKKTVPRKKVMATWESEKFGGNVSSIEENFDGILVTHDLQDCLDDSLDLASFGRVYEQTPVFDYGKYSDEDVSCGVKLPDDRTG